MQIRGCHISVGLWFGLKVEWMRRCEYWRRCCFGPVFVLVGYPPERWAAIEAELDAIDAELEAAPRVRPPQEPT